MHGIRGRQSQSLAKQKREEKSPVLLLSFGRESQRPKKDGAKEDCRRSDPRLLMAPRKYRLGIVLVPSLEHSKDDGGTLKSPEV